MMENVFDRIVGVMRDSEKVDEKIIYKKINIGIAKVLEVILRDDFTDS